MNSDSDQISVDYHSRIQKERETFSEIFLEDLYKNITQKFRVSKESVNCFLDPENKSFEKFLCDLLPYSNRGSYSDFNDIILGTIEFIAYHLVHHGFVIFELVKSKDFNDNVLYKLLDVNSLYLKVEEDHIIQGISNEDAVHLNISTPIKIPKKKCFIITFPTTLGGMTKYLDYIENFKLLAEQNPMIYLNHTNKSLTGKIGYDITQHQRLHELEFWRYSKTFNWHHRTYSGKEFSDYYYIYRRLKFTQSKIILRDYIIDQLNIIVSELSCRFGEKTSLNVEGIIQLSKIIEELEQWNSGELNIANDLGCF